MMNDEQFGADFDLDLKAPRPPRPKGDDPFDRSKWGLFPDMPCADYFADPAPDGQPSLGNSGMGVLLNETPLDFAFQHPRLNPDAERLKETVASRTGDVVHRLALGKGKDYVVSPEHIKEFRTNEAKAWRDEVIASGKTPIIGSKFKEAEATAAIMRERIDAVLEGAPYETEVVFLHQVMTEAGPIWVRGMLDVWCKERAVILDLKASGQIYDAMLARQMVNMGWDRQGALYPWSVGQIIPELAGRIRFADLIVKPEAPFTSRLVAAEKAWTASSLRLCQRAAEIFGKCLYAGEWPGFSKEVHHVQMPAWEEKRREALELGE